MKSVLVTGANGFVGRYFVNKLLKEGIDVTAVVRKEGQLTDIKNRHLKVIVCSMEEVDKLSVRLKGQTCFDIVFHLAWSGANGSECADYRRQSDNIRQTLDVVNIASQLGIKRFVGAGSLTEYDNLFYLPKDGIIPNANSMYGAAKISAHFMSKIECNRMGIEHVWGIFANVYGIGDVSEGFINTTVKGMITGKRLRFTLGEQYYDFLYISDLINGLYLMGDKGKTNHEYFIGSGCPRKLKEYIYIIRDAVDKNIQLNLGEVPFNGITLQLEQLSIDKLQNEVGYEPKVKFEHGIHKTVEWTKQCIKAGQK